MAEESRASVRIPTQGLEEMAFLAENAGGLKAIAKALSDSPLKLGDAEMVAEVAKLVGKPESVVAQIRDGLTSLYAIKSRLPASAKETVAAVTAGLESARRWWEQHQQEWLAGQDVIVEVLDCLAVDGAIAVRQKTQRLARLHERRLLSGSIITDVRPVFNDAADRILETIVSHVLSIEYLEDGESRAMQVSLDASDIRELRGQCERAERKVATLQKELEKVSWVPKVDL